MNSCEVKTYGWNTKKCHTSEVAELTAHTLPRTAFFKYITLAKESPNRIQESDEDFYNSFNEQETDICHDSSDISDSDTESQCSSISQHLLDNPLGTIATMEVLEYEVASASETDNDFSAGSSSGTEDYVLAAFAQAVADNSSASEFAILADTEESDDQSCDSDFAPADYWKCVKCNNKQNNPMYRYCERCYQVRKSLFPPRPKQKRKMRYKEVVQNDDLTDSSSSSASSLVSNSSSGRKNLASKKNCTRSHNSNNKEGSSGRTSESESGIDRVEKKSDTQKIAFAKKDVPPPSRRNTSSPESISDRKNYKRRVQDDMHNNESHCPKKRCDSDIISIKADEVKTKSLHLDVFKDSGFSSSSSQEKSPTEEEKPLFEESSSQEIFNANEDSEKSTKNLDVVETFDLVPMKPYPTLSQLSCISVDSVLGSYKEDVTFEHKSETLRETLSSDFSAKISNSESNLGFCMFCLSEPKNSVFVHSNFVHLCCCYKCAIKIWKQRKACPICNCKVKNVMKLFVH